MTANPYAAFKDASRPAEEAMAALQALVEEAKSREAQIAKLEDELKSAKEALREITTVKLPSLMDEIGLAEVKTSSGIKVSVKEEIEAGISEERRELAHRWLEENGHAALIKREVTVAFNREQSEMAAELVKDLSGKYPGVSQESRVHPATLKAWVRGMLGDGKDIPLDTFGVFRRRIAKLSS